MTYDRIVIIYNPNSTGDSEHKAKALATVLKKRLPDLDITCIATAYAGHAEAIAEKVARESARPLIVSSSGDGGYNEVVNGVMAAGNPTAMCAVLAAGNANDHSRTMQSRPLEESIITGKVTRIDLLECTIKSHGSAQVRYAHSYGGLGLTPVVAVELNRHSLNSFKEAVIVLKTFLKYRPFKIKHKGNIIQLDSLLFGNINQMAKVLTIAPKNKPADGKFEVVAFPSRRKWGLVKRLAQAAVSSLDNAQQATEYNFEVIKRMPLQLDGEVVVLPPRSQVCIRCCPQVLATVA